jgi:osmotically inducible protein OsmC
MATHSKGSATWAGDLTGGHGTVSAGNGGFSTLPTSWAARAESRASGTSPEELIAAAHASCFSMAFAGRLAKNGTNAERLDVSATVTFDKTDAGNRIISSALDVTGRVPGIDQATFAKIADDAKENCPVSQALKNNVKLSVSAKLA